MKKKLDFRAPLGAGMHGTIFFRLPCVFFLTQKNIKIFTHFHSSYTISYMPQLSKISCGKYFCRLLYFYINFIILLSKFIILLSKFPGSTPFAKNQFFRFRPNSNCISGSFPNTNCIFFELYWDGNLCRHFFQKALLCGAKNDIRDVGSTADLVFLVPTGTHWYPLVPTGTHWYPLVL